MRVKVKMPKLGLTMTEATIVEWRKAVGDAVTAGADSPNLSKIGRAHV